MVQVVADFGPRGQAVVDDEDFEALRGYNWRMEVLGRVVRSMAQQGKSNRTLAQDVAARMGLDAGDRQVKYRDGSQLNCTRGNLYLGGRRGGPRGFKAVTYSQPQGVHRSRSERRCEDESSAPPAGYLLRWHAGECRFSGAHTVCLLRHTGAWIGMAYRITRTTRPFGSLPGGRSCPAGWQFRTPSGEKFTDENYFAGVAELLRRHRASRPVAGAA